MKAVARIYWTLFTAFPVQRWLGAGGVGLAVLGLVTLGLGRDARAIGVSGGLLGFFVCAIIPAVFAAGGNLRALSAPRGHSLLPFFRRRVLCALALFAATIGAAWFVVATWIVFLGGRDMSIALTLIYVVGMVTAVVLWIFALTAQPNWLWAGVVVPLAFWQWVSAGGPSELRESGVPLPWIVFVVSATAWIAFTTWYLRTRCIRPVILTVDGRGAGWPWRTTAEPSDLTRASALRTLLAGYAQRSLARQLVIAAGIGAVLCFAAPLLQYLPGQQPSTPPFTRFVWPFYAMLITAFTAHPVVRQSRYLWLHVPGARLEILKVVEGMLARVYARVATCIATLVVLGLSVLEATPREAVWGIALMGSAALYAVWLALAAVRRVWLIVGGVFFMLLIQAVVLQIWVEETLAQPPSAVLGGMVAIHLAAAGLFRAVARLRWRNIDWLEFRPLRLGRNEFR